MKMQVFWNVTLVLLDEWVLSFQRIKIREYDPSKCWKSLTQGYSVT